MAKSSSAKQNFAPGTSRRSRSARTLRLQMAMEQEQREAMGQRIKDLREGKRLRQQAVADAVGVTLRAYQAWEAGDSGIKWENAEALAGPLDTTASYILHGAIEPGETPDPFANGPEPSQLDRIEQRLTDIEELLRLLDATSRTTRALLQNEEQLAAADTPDADDDPAAPGQARPEGTTGSGSTPGR